MQQHTLQRVGLFYHLTFKAMGDKLNNKEEFSYRYRLQLMKQFTVDTSVLVSRAMTRLWYIDERGWTINKYTIQKAPYLVANNSKNVYRV